ncbi:DUF397 domain-containing protein [Streptomyces sp. WZ-12]|uniref:DUF397 domain-containing protein n=1 Tax=Streptomyces sp. WZ-12 TaxID=3030210 RepID=UPI0023812538|nr:DUF397 domain-containing protein [Streptomyces sp. WZ-12]
MTTNSPRWFKSSYSSNGGNCVEVAANVPGAVPVRDSKDPHGPALAFSALAWQAFVGQVKSGSRPAL